MTFCVLAPEHELVERIVKLGAGSDDETLKEAAAQVIAYRENAKRLTETDRQAAHREKTGVFTGFHAINPANGERVSIWVADYVMASYGTGAIMAVPGHDERDFEFAQKFGLEVKRVIAPSDRPDRPDQPDQTDSADWPPLPWTDKEAAVVVNSGEYSGRPVKQAQNDLGEWMEALGIGERKTTYRLRDWLISRQRYWGCPIPVVFDKEGDEHLAPEDCLPVELPDVENYEPGEGGESPLAAIPEFVNAACPDGGGLCRRETDTMGGFACSSWYFLRFCDPGNADCAWSPESVEYWMPVDTYVGGAEHAVMHLLYARFWTKVLYDEGLVPVKEPFQRLMNQGQVLAKTPYRKPREGEKLDVGEEGILISFEEAASLPQDQVFYRWARMSKSKGNVVTPDEMVEKYGADALRIFELFVAPFDADVQWESEGVEKSGSRFLGRVFRMALELAPHFDPEWRLAMRDGRFEGAAASLRGATHRAIKKATEDIERFAFNTYVAALMSFLNEITDAMKSASNSPTHPINEPPLRMALSEALETFILLLAPAAPFSADELWESLPVWQGKPPFTYLAEWPKWDPEIAKEDVLTIAVQVNGKLRDTLELLADSTNEELEKAALASPKVQVHLDGKSVRKVIVVPGKLVNVVAN
jgi:leucyl-tRNA synthetase